MNVANRTFVNRRARDVIMQEMRCRIDRGDMNCEIKETIQVSSFYIGVQMSFLRRKMLNIP